MNFLIDMNLPASWTDFLTGAGHTAVDWSDEGPPDASDHALLAWAADRDYVILTADLDLAALPVLDGAEETANAGILSSLQPANVRLRRALRNQQEMVTHPRYRLLFDPQTAGGLLASVPAGAADACIAQLRAAGYPQAAIIGRVLAQGEATEPITLRG